MGKAILYIITVAIVWLLICAIWPYWNRYLIKTDVKAAALYGTKHSITDARKLLEEKLNERGVNFDPQDCNIEKDENKTVSIEIIYSDKISFLGIILKKLEFKLEVTEEETEERF